MDEVTNVNETLKPGEEVKAEEKQEERKAEKDKRADSKTSQWLEANLKLIPDVMSKIHQNVASNGARVVSCNISFDGYDSMTTQVHVVFKVETETGKMKKTLEEIRTKNKEQEKQQEELWEKRENLQTQRIVTNNAESLLGKVADIDFAHNNNVDGISIDFKK